MNARFLAAGLLVWAASFALGADKEVEALLAKMRSIYSGTKSAHVVVKTTNNKLGSKPITVDMYYMAGRKIRASVDGIASRHGKTYRYTSNGSRVAYDDFAGNVQYGDFSLDVPIPVNLEAMSFWDWKRQLSTSPGSNMQDSRFRIKSNEPWNGKKWTVLEETAYGQDVFVRYFLDPSTAMIYRVVVYDLARKEIRQETIVQKLERNVRVDPKMFEVKETRARVRSGIQLKRGAEPTTGPATRPNQNLYQPPRKVSHSRASVV